METNNFVEKFVTLCKKDRLISFYKGQKFTDCTFNINGIQVKAHKLILACSSPVFEKMFFGEMASSDIIVCDIKVEEFNQVLEFIYTENIVISTVSNAWSVFYIARKYLLDDLTHICLEYIKKKLTVNTLALSYEFAEVYDIEEVKKKCFSDMLYCIKGVLCCDYHMKPATLRQVLEGNLCLDNFELIIKVISWGTIECQFRNMSITSENIIDVLNTEDIIGFIRKQWLVNLMCTNCCDSLIMCQCIDELTHETIKRLDGILVKKEEPSRINKLFYKPLPNICRFRKVYKIAGRIDLQTSEEYVSSVIANHKIMLFGVLINTEMNTTRLQDSFYEGSVTVRICEQNTNCSVVKPTTVKGAICYDSDLYISLKDVIILEANLVYDIRISYKNNNNIISQIHSYYMSNELVNGNDNCFISFYEMFGTVIKGLSFYAA